jgi:plastocyanin
MKRAVAVAGCVTLLAAGIAAVPFSPLRAPATAQVLVHCPNGNQGAFVTPQQVTIAVGDSIVWRMTGQVTSDTLVISLKDDRQAWPFGGAMPKGKTSAQTGDARVKGTYGYNVHLECRLPGGGTEPVVIDPDIIID